MNRLLELQKELKKVADSKRVKNLQRFFKTGKGEYGEGDKFLGITVPDSRKIAVKFKNLDFVSIERLLRSKIHEERLIALLILICKLDQTNILENVRINEKIYNFYLKNTKYINNWDLVDLSAPNIVGEYLFNLVRGLASAKALAGRPVKNNQILINLAKSDNVWERRIAIMATYAFIKNNKFEETLKIAKMLLHDEHDLIHKAVGWMLREVGKKDLKTEEKFLKKYYKKMPRTMLRYAIEKFSKNKRSFYLSGKSRETKFI